MKKLFIILTFLLVTSAYASDFPEGLKFFGIDSDSQIRGPKYREIVAELKDLEISYPDFAKVFTYGKSVGGRPLTLIKIALKDSKEILPAIYIGGTIHGDEYLNIEDRLPRWFLSEASKEGPVASYLKRGGAIYIAPILNPDGYEKRERENKMGVDLNRDYTVMEANVTGFTQPETTSLIAFLKEDLGLHKRTLELAWDYHCCIGALLYLWSFKGPVIPEVDRLRHADMGTIMQKVLGKKLKYGTTPVILGYSAKGTSKDFYYEAFGARGFTFEGRRGVEDRHFDDHTVMWSKIIQALSL